MYILNVTIEDWSSDLSIIDYYNIIISTLLLTDITFEDFQYTIFKWLAGYINIVVIWEESKIF